MSRIFIDRPIFAWVIAIIIMLMGIGAITALPVAQYPDVAPTQINIRASYPGASAATLESSVTQILEQQLTGIDGMLYFQSSSTARGQVTINVILEKGIDPDIAQVQVQNAIQTSIPRLPQQVQQQGVRVSKSSPDLLLIVGIYDETDRSTNFDVSDWLTTNMQDELSRVPGVGDVNVFGSSYAMRIWLDPQKLASFQLMPSDVVTAIQNQNTEVAAGEVGGVPQPEGQMLNATVTAQSRLQTPEQFRNIIVKADPSGARVLLGDVARVELGADNYSARIRANGHPGAGIGISLEPGANALLTANLVKAKVADIAPRMPAGYNYAYANDTSDFIKLSVIEVVKTLMEAIVLVVLVIFVFLQSWRATLIPFIAVPVVLLGTFAVLYALGFSINTMTLFGLVLATGLLVDDAIVVVENVERLMHENPDMTPRQATIESMGQIQMALIGIAMVLSAVFLPMVFFGGSTGVIYRQFSATIVSAMILSIFIALTLSPAIAANSAQAEPRNGRGNLAGPHGASRGSHDRAWTGQIQRGLRPISPLVCRDGSSGRRPQMDLPVHLRGRLRAADDPLSPAPDRLPSDRRPGRGIRSVSSARRRDFDQNARRSTKGRGLFPERAGEEECQNLLHGRRRRPGRGRAEYGTGVHQPRRLRQARERQGFGGFDRPAGVRCVSRPPRRAGVRAGSRSDPRPRPVERLYNGDPEHRKHDSGSIRRCSRQAPGCRFHRSVACIGATDELPDVASLKVDINQQRLAALGLSAGDVNGTISTAWGGRYVNDFIDRGRVKRVYVQGDAPYRAAPTDIGQWFVRNVQGEMVPFSSFSQTEWMTTPTSLSRFNGYPSFEFSGQGAPGVSSGQAMNIIDQLASQIPGITVAWAGQSYQERLASGQAPILYGVALLVVFLCLAALYESWSIPVAVLLVIPLGLVGSIFAVTLRGLQNDVYLQVGLITTMGLSAKNAILMVEFAERAEKEGKRVIDAAIEAARIRLRPILMTSFAFIFGVLPLAISTGAGANSRIAIGTAVVGGMLTATILAIFYIPLFFVIVRRSVREGLKVVRERFRGRRKAEA